ncbi:MAG: ribonuclease Y [Candidatus Improbicoccus devescovinae]|nr:MAG: ribonuclease Y [Candidatus Improbicoccus devescovinae]
MGVIICLISLILIALSFVVGFYIRKLVSEKKAGSKILEAEKFVEKYLKEAETKKKEIIIEGKDEVFRLKEEIDKEINLRRKEIILQESRVRQREEMYEKKLEAAESKEKLIEKKIKSAQECMAEVEKLKQFQVKKLEEIARMNKEQAKNYIIENLKNDLAHERAVKILEFKQDIEEEKKNISKNILALATQKYAAEHIEEISISVVNLPNDDMKGRIIGREGRNIRCIENLTGVDLIIDDTPEMIAISSFDPLRREIARQTIEALIIDGRIHPAKIESIVNKTKEEIDLDMLKAGQKAVIDVGARGVHTEIIKLLGRLKYRTSYGQNVLEHSLEVSHICGILAAELGENITVAKRCGLLHDIGKALTHEFEGAHPDLGAEISKKYKESNEVVNCILNHHSTSEVTTCINAIVQAADAASAARPGARRENFENYIKRLNKLESLVSSFPGVERCYAIQAGREVRVMVNPDKINDDAMVILAKDVCQKIESELTYPGQIKLNLIRENRAIQYAK